jgi:hypothetical protein
VKELLDLASWIARHPRFRSLLRFLPDGGYVQITRTGFLDVADAERIMVRVRLHELAPVMADFSRPQRCLALVARAVHALRLRARQLARRNG